jgi:Na+-translocating ferredoxin:NAD+ oxidoreductase subunit B
MTRDDVESLVDAVDRLLPQTQCTRCGYDGCRPYAEALVRTGAPINRCPPGGAAGIERLASLLGRPVLMLDPACGVEGPRRVARIVAELCIGCTRCIQACPVDAIAGAPRRLHAVLERHCTGCELCLPPCPTDCIEMVAPDAAEAGWNDADASRARDRFRQRNLRRNREADAGAGASSGTGEATASPSGSDTVPGVAPGADAAAARKRAMIEAAVQRAKARAQPDATR